MASFYRWHRACLLTLGALTSPGVAEAPFTTCRTRVYNMLDGGNETFQSPVGQIDRWNVGMFLYTGPVTGLHTSFNRSKYVTLTLEGCQYLCDDPIEWYWTHNPTLSLTVALNWVIPIISLIASLPYDSPHARPARQSRARNGRFLTTVSTFVNWTGSPQTALTAVLWNIHQIRQCLRHTFFAAGANEESSDALTATKRDAYCVLGCVNQFELPADRGRRRELLRTLAYGLTRPMRTSTTTDPGPERLTRDLLSALAFQLRMYRRRGVYPMLLNLVVFVVAFFISVGLAFSELGTWNTAHSLALGLLFSWLPVLVLFSIIDRNPVSSGRNAVLIQRWLWNAAAVSAWEEDASGDEIDWWTPAKQKQALQVPSPNLFLLGKFIGQGRQLGYFGLVHHFLESVYDAGGFIKHWDDIASATNDGIEHPWSRPASWWAIAITALLVVWCEILMAFVVSYSSPIVGLSCRSGAYLVYGMLGTLSWLISCARKNPGDLTKALCYTANGLSFVSLLFIVFAQLSGIFNNCVCKCGFTGHMGLEAPDFYRNNFDLERWWIVGAVMGGVPLVACVAAALFLHFTLKSLWRASEDTAPTWADSVADVRWLT